MNAIIQAAHIKIIIANKDRMLQRISTKTAALDFQIDLTQSAAQDVQWLISNGQARPEDEENGAYLANRLEELRVDRQIYVHATDSLNLEIIELYRKLEELEASPA